MQADKFSQPDPALAFNIMKFSLQLYQKPADKLSEKEYSTVKQCAEQEVYLHDLILASDEACGVIIPDEVVTHTLDSLIKEYPSEDAFFEYLAENHLLLSGYQESLKNDLKVEAVLARVASRKAVTLGSEITAYYLSHHESFLLPERRAARHILICTENQYSHLPKDAALRRIRTIHGRLIENPGLFAEEAALYSECSSSSDGGKLGKVRRGELCEVLDEALFSLRTGEISGIVQSEIGFHIVYCEMIYPEQPMVFSEAYLKIHQILDREKKLKHCKEWLQALLEKH